MIRKLYFDVRDMPLAARSGLSARKLWIYWKALVTSWLVWSFSIYLGYFAAGADLAARWEHSRLLPLPGGIFLESWASILLMVAGLLIVLYIMLRASLMVARITFEQLRGDDFYSGRDAGRFCRKNCGPLTMTPFALLSGVLIATLCGLLFGLAGRIPAAGPVVIGLLSVPAWGLALLVVLLAVGFILSFMLVPPIVASTRGDTFESLFELFSSFTSQPWRIFLYWITGLFFRFIGLLVLIFFTTAAISFLSFCVSTGMGIPGLGATLSSGLQMVAPEAVPFFANVFNPLSSTAPGESWTGLAGLLAGLSGISILLVIKSYWLSSGSSLWTLIYLAVRYRKDGEDLLKRADEEEQREFEKLYGSASTGSRCSDSPSSDAKN